MTLPKSAMIGKNAQLLPAKSALNALGKTNRTIVDYSKQVPTNPVDNPQPLLVNLMSKVNT